MRIYVIKLYKINYINQRFCKIYLKYQKFRNQIKLSLKKARGMVKKIKNKFTSLKLRK